MPSPENPELTPDQTSELRATILDVDKSEALSLKCPDCAGPVRLLAGKFGLFYLCMTSVGVINNPPCPGRFSANLDGTPKGVPGNQATKHVRREVHRLMEAHPHLDWPLLELELGRQFAKLDSMSQEDCELVIRFIKHRPTVWELLDQSFAF